VDRNGKERVRTFSEETHVTVYPMDEKEIQDYVSSGEPDDKAGAYGIQGRFAAYIKKINGDYSNVVGLPAGRVCQELKAIFQEMESIV
jgi:septum formation protein